jgi:hypothetical protein
VSPELDSIAETIGPGNNMFHEFFFLVLDIKIGPDGYTEQQKNIHCYNESVDQTLPDYFYHATPCLQRINSDLRLLDFMQPHRSRFVAWAFGW